jgi:hypothetical protein
LPVLIGFGGGGREDRLLGVSPELICYRHGQPRAPIPIPACIPWKWPSGQNCSVRSNEGQAVQYETESNRGKESAVRLKVR